MSLQATTWQTVGPFFCIGLAHLNTRELAPAGTKRRVMVKGQVLDGNAEPIADAILEIWQANAKGNYGGKVNVPARGGSNRPAKFCGFGRIPTDAKGRFRFTTIAPGRVPGPGGILQAPHLAVRVMMRGLLRGLITRMYFPTDATETDPVLQLVTPKRRKTLIAAQSVSQKAGAAETLVWNIHMQGDEETVFFEC